MKLNKQVMELCRVQYQSNKTTTMCGGVAIVRKNINSKNIRSQAAREAATFQSVWQLSYGPGG